jgi:hypothetical protein
MINIDPLRMKTNTEKLQISYADVYSDLLKRAILVYLSKLPEEDFPREDQIRSANQEAQSLVMEEITGDKFLSQLSAEPFELKKRAPLLILDLKKWVSENPLIIPLTATSYELIGWRIALAAVVGTIGGGILFSAIFRLLMGNPDLGIIIGGPLGAFLVVMAMWKTSRSKKIRRIIQSLLGVTSLAEIWLTFSGLSGLGGLWRSLLGKPAFKGFFGLFKRIFVYLGLIFLLNLAIRKPVFEIQDHELLAREYLDIWIKSAVLKLHLLITEVKPEEKEEPVNEKLLLKDLASYLYRLHHSAPELLPITASELIIHARNLGLEGLEKEPVFISGSTQQEPVITWEKSLTEKYNLVGVIEEGDKVNVEEPPVIYQGKIIQKGLVRKVRR